MARVEGKKLGAVSHIVEKTPAPSSSASPDHARRTANPEAPRLKPRCKPRAITAQRVVTTPVSLSRCLEGSSGEVPRRAAHVVHLRDSRVPEWLRGHRVRRRQVHDLPLQHLRADLGPATLDPFDHRVRAAQCVSSSCWFLRHSAGLIGFVETGCASPNVGGSFGR